ncbi:hypothetical protein PJI17_32930, partial [Mycobacterium kansasii]
MIFLDLFFHQCILELRGMLSNGGDDHLMVEIRGREVGHASSIHGACLDVGVPWILLENEENERERKW